MRRGSRRDPLRILALAPGGLINAVYRAYAPMGQLQERGHVVRVETFDERIDARLLLEGDVVFCWRLFHERFRRMLAFARDHGRAIVWDNDDDLTRIPKGTSGYQRYGGLRGERELADMVATMRLADVVTASSAQLAERYREVSGADVRVVENHLPADFEAPARPADGRVVVGWVAALEHQHDAERLRLREVLLELLERHVEVDVVTVGVNLGLRHERYRHVPPVEYRHLPAQIAAFDLAIAPLADIPFNRARSNVKLKEYAALGVPWLASPVGSYRPLGEREGGVLVGDDRWPAELSALVTDARRRRRLAKRGRAWARGETIAARVQEWEDVFVAAREKAARRAASVA